MKVLYGLGSLPEKASAGCVVTVGVFDGVHKGHRKIITSVLGQAKKMGLKSTVVTFGYHPSHCFSPKEKIPAITSLEHKLQFIKELGIDTCYVLNFDKRFSMISAEDFVRKILIKKIGMRYLYVGEDFVFGRGGRGDTGLLKRLSEKLDFSLCVMRHLKIHNRIVSSTLIRSLIKTGNIELAEIFLGRRVSFLGKVIKGEGRGKRLGFPTANIHPQNEVIVPDGIYATIASFAKKPFNSVTYIGRKPTFHKRSAPRNIEVFFLSLNKNIYGAKVEVRIIKKIRDDKKFRTPDELIVQMKRDTVKAEAILK